MEEEEEGRGSVFLEFVGDAPSTITSLPYYYYYNNKNHH